MTTPITDQTTSSGQIPISAKRSESFHSRILRAIRRWCLKCIICPSLVITSLGLLHEAHATELLQNALEYTVVKGDYGGIIAGRLGMEWSHIARQNDLDPDSPIMPGQLLRLHFMRIVPEPTDDGIIINIPDRTLYRFENGKLKDYSFISAGKPTWQTPLGEFTVTAKAKDPTWFVPPSIQREMEAEGKDILVEVPPGPDNPLGKYWLQLSIKGVGLHATNAPQSIYKFRSHGCMRLRPEVAERLYRDVPVGTQGKIVYRPVKMFKTPAGKVLIEAYRDVYKKGIDYEDEVRKILTEMNAANDVDWEKVKLALEKKDGVVRDVSR